MHARVTSLQGDPANAEAGIANFRDNVVPFAKEAGKGAILLLDRESGKAMAITLWEDEQALSSSEAQADTLRTGASSAMAAAGADVARYEVAVFEV